MPLLFPSIRWSISGPSSFLKLFTLCLCADDILCQTALKWLYDTSCSVLLPVARHVVSVQEDCGLARSDVCWDRLAESVRNSAGMLIGTARI